MATGVQATTTLSATTETKVYEVPSGYTWTGYVNVCNRNSSTVNVRVALGSNASMATGMYIEYDVPLTAAGTAGNVLNLTGLLLGSTQAVWVYASAGSVDVVVGGYEE